MSTEKAEKETTQLSETTTTTTKPSSDYEARWKVIVQDLANFDGDEFKSDPVEEKDSTSKEKPSGDSAVVGEVKKESLGAGEENGGGNGPTDEDSLQLKECNPEDDELNQFTMPGAQSFLTDMSRYRHGKKLYVHPLTHEDLYHNTVVELTTSPACLEFRVHFYRDNTDQRAPQGLLTLFFSSNEAMTVAMTELQKIREDLTVETHEAKSQKKLMPLWNRKSKEATGTALKDCVLCICNVPPKTTVEQLEKFFPTAKDVVIPVACDRGSKMKPRQGYAYAVYETPEGAEAVAKQYETERPCLATSVLGVYRYKEGSKKLHGLLSLTQRKLVLKHGAKAAAAVEKINSGEEVKSPEVIKNKLKRCVELIEKDNEARRTHGLTMPSYERLIRMKTLPTLNSKETQRILAELRVIPATGRPRHPGSFVPSASANSSTDGGNFTKKQQKKIIRKTIRSQSKTSGLLGGMPSYMNNPMMMMGYGFGYNPYGAGFNMFGRGGYGGYGYTNGGYRNGGGFGKDSQGAGGNVRPLMDSVTRGSYNQGSQSYLQQQGSVNGRRQLNQSNNHATTNHQQRISGLNQFNGYNNNGYTSNRDTRNLYGRYSPNRGMTAPSSTAGGCGDNWWQGGGYNGGYKF